MFSKLLVDSPDVVVKLDWLGMGAMKVMDKRTGVEAVGSLSLKSHMLEAARSLAQTGLDYQNNAVAFALLIERYGKFALAPNDLITRAVLSQSPDQIATAFLQELADRTSQGGT